MSTFTDLGPSSAIELQIAGTNVGFRNGRIADVR
jgi:hypothetical protein